MALPSVPVDRSQHQRWSRYSGLTGSHEGWCAAARAAGSNPSLPPPAIAAPPAAASPPTSRRDLRAYLDCGILTRGFARVR